MLFVGVLVEVGDRCLEARLEERLVLLLGCEWLELPKPPEAAVPTEGGGDPVGIGGYIPLAVDTPPEGELSSLELDGWLERPEPLAVGPFPDPEPEPDPIGKGGKTPLEVAPLPGGVTGRPVPEGSFVKPVPEGKIDVALEDCIGYG